MKPSRLFARFLAVILLSLMVASSVFAQLTTDWEYLYDDLSFPFAAARSLELTSENDLVIVGNEYHGGDNGYRFLALRLDLDGNEISRTTSTSISIGMHVEQTSNDGWILSTYLNNGTVRYFDSNYQFRWLRDFDGFIGESCEVYGNRTVAPLTYTDRNSEIYMINRNGQTNWVYTVPLSNMSVVNDVVITCDSSLVFPTEDNGGQLYLFKIDIFGNMTWNTSFHIDGIVTPMKIDYLTDGGFIVSGYIRENNNEIGAVRFDHEGHVVFMSLGTNGQSLEMSDGSIINIEAFYLEVSYFYWFDASGQLIDVFTYEFDNPPVFQQRIADVEVTGDSSFAVCGKCGNELFNRLSAFVTHFTLPPTDVEINIEAYRQPLFIRRQGVFYWYGEVRNNTTSPMTRDVWVQVRKPDGSLSGALALWSDLEIPANGEITATVRQGVPLDAPLGGYNYIVRVGDYPNPQFQHHFALTVVDTPEEEQPADMSDEPRPSDFTLRIEPDTWNVSADGR